MSQPESSESFDQLAALATERFKWQWDEVLIADQPYRLAVAADPEGMLIEACERQDAGEEGVIDPFWATTWRAASGLDRYLDRIVLDDVPVLELGCGTGHAGIAAVLRGARATLTDGVDDPLLLVRMSVLNLSQQNQAKCNVQRLRFGIDKIETKFPVILGSDVTYLRTLWPELDHCLRDHLADGGEVLLSDPYRIIANEFRGWIQDRGWHYVEHKIDLADDPEHPIRVMRLTSLK
ncbi:putative methyltransferase [Planctomycetes bacterium CA13]|uniref:Putative methyltransferase n=2 Tax=Novipirellula herctigrandis TaxID=2527986 RepID=A0A5C5Z5D9_9BACT|nr:putative methyltransferase [Planctomycetes bacterium CA13]